MSKNFRRYLIAGLAVILPLAITLWVLVGVFKFIDEMVASLVFFLTGYQIVWPGIGVVATVGVVLVIGMLATNILGKKLLDFWEKVLLQIPLVKPIYTVVKQIVDTVSRKDEQVFRQVVLVEYPRRGAWVIAFLIGDAKEDFFGEMKVDLVKVFVPTVPNPTSGFLVIVPRSDLAPVSISVEDGLKFVLSAGIINPVNGEEKAKLQRDLWKWTRPNNGD
ncbi:MAG: DUF502 domain-containing protein [Eubacteriales bacterium]|jgi:uncharacterized membrane protein|nr:DUF502 domain-containing protein [Bacillota bacterium]MBV1726820.1 DUF502 domain-containing protein [Desulforudis sp.]MDP3051430.1 DUF502 domain-containing protein [Eubacteriales bacterium]MDQ7790265.1 DUF502 domain-containing protein [Clostridia bacterium]MBV1735781.1 DUF502 domain-containing protein [Desulforudis sp.]